MLCRQADVRPVAHRCGPLPAPSSRTSVFSLSRPRAVRLETPDSREAAMQASAHSIFANSATRIIICSGLQSSGSTWLFNIVIELIQLQNKDFRIARFFADTLDAIPEAGWDSDYLVIKCHAPSASLLALAAQRNAPVLMTVRDPKDAAVSFAQRFLLPVDTSILYVVASANALVKIAPEQISLLLQYETHFTRKIETVHRVANCLGIEISDADAASIFEKFTPQRVQESIDRLEKQGAFAPGLERAVQYDPETHWHPGHVGDGKIGKFHEVLSKQQQTRIMHETRAYARAFGYPAAWADVDALQATQSGLIALLKRAGHDAPIKAALDQTDFVFVPVINFDANPGDLPIRYDNDGCAILILKDGNFNAPSSGRTAGFSIQVTDAFERAASGHKIRIRAVVRSSSTETQLALAYSTNEVGNSGWQRFVAGPQWQVIEFNYAVPQMKNGLGDFIGVMAGPADMPAVEVCLVTARVIPDAAA